MKRNAELAQLEREFGVVLPGVQDFATREMARDYRIAMDAQPTMLTVPNNGIPAWFSTFIDPDVIRIAVSPLKGTQILGNEVQKGDWTSSTAMFPVAEYAGETSSYGDWNNNGSVGLNFQFVSRQPYHYQTITQWGEREVDLVGLAKINYKNELDLASVAVLNRFQNKTYFYGVSGIINYGLLNDPSLPAALTPSTKAAGGTGWALATPNEVYDDIKRMFAQLVLQTKGLVEMDTPIVVAMSPQSQVYLSNANSFGVTVTDLLKKNFPNIRFETAPEYATAGGNLVQMFAPNINGQDTGYTAFTEKLRTHAIVPDLSAWKQKKSQGTWGAIIKQPIAYVQMLGV